jgi:tetratricopeptide (TPR) repeat protein
MNFLTHTSPTCASTMRNGRGAVLLRPFVLVAAHIGRSKPAPLHGLRRLPELFTALLAATLLANAQPNELFQKAGRAYDTGDFAGAGNAYAELLKQGYASPQVYFNLGNAEFRLGHGGAAALAYRRAWHLAPRDADIAANLQFALEQSGAVLPAAPLWARWLQSLSAGEWRTVALVLFWLLAVLACVALLLPARRKVFRPLVFAAFAAFLIALGGVGYWLDLQVRQPEAVVMQNSKVLFAPLPNATEYYALPAGAIVRIEAQDGAWLRINSADRPGWLPQTNCIAICPAPAGGAGP